MGEFKNSRLNFKNRLYQAKILKKKVWLLFKRYLRQKKSRFNPIYMIQIRPGSRRKQSESNVKTDLTKNHFNLKENYRNPMHCRSKKLKSLMIQSFLKLNVATESNWK